MAVRVMKTSFTASSDDMNKLFACNRISAQIWNKTLEKASVYGKANDGKWASRSYLRKEVKNRYPLHSQSIQEVVHRYVDARESAKAARDKGYQNKYPWREKHNFNTKWIDEAFSFDFEAKTLSLSLGIWNHKRQKPIVVKLPKDTIDKLRNIVARNKDAISEVELCYNNGLRLHITYNDGVEAEPNPNATEIAGVDLGEIHAIAACATNGKSVIITGRKIRSVHRLRNKQLKSITKAQAEVVHF